MTLSLFRPLHIISGALLYVMGVGIGDYLGLRVDFSVFFWGLLWVISLQLGAILLGEYLNNPLQVGILNRPPFTSPTDEGGGPFRGENLLFLAVIFLSLCAAFTVILEIQGRLGGSLVFLMTGLLFSYFIQIWPSLRVEFAGWGEILTTMQVVVFIPALGFVFQSGEYHRFLGLTTFPLFSLHMAMMLAWQLPSYAADAARNTPSTLTQMGWKKGIFLHNMLVIVAFLMLGLSTFLGFPDRFVVPGLLALPLGAFQVWYLYRLTQGAPTRWKFLISLSVVLFLLPAYLFTYAFWTQ